MEIKTIRYLNLQERKRFKTDKQMFAIELKDGNIIVCENGYLYNNKDNTLNQIVGVE